MIGRELLSKLSCHVCSCSDRRMQDKNHIKTDNTSIGNVALNTLNCLNDFFLEFCSFQHI